MVFEGKWWGISLGFGVGVGMGAIGGAVSMDNIWYTAQRVWCEEQGAVYVHAEGVDRYMCAKPAAPQVAGAGEVLILANRPQPGIPGTTTFVSQSGRNGAPGGPIVLQIGGGDEVMRFEPDGGVVVHGRAIATDVEVYNAAREWVIGAHLMHGGEKLE